MTESEKAAQTAADQRTTKKPYRKPHLQVYGDLRKLTNTVGVRGRRDGPIKFLRTRP